MCVSVCEREVEGRERGERERERERERVKRERVKRVSDIGMLTYLHTLRLLFSNEYLSYSLSFLLSLLLTLSPLLSFSLSSLLPLTFLPEVPHSPHRAPIEAASRLSFRSQCPQRPRIPRDLNRRTPKIEELERERERGREKRESK